MAEPAVVEGVPIALPVAEAMSAGDVAEFFRTLTISQAQFHDDASLDLSRTGLRDPVLPQLAMQLKAKRTPLTELDLSGNRFEDEAVASLIAALPDGAPALKTLNLAGPEVQTGGFAQALGEATAAALTAAIPQLPNLTTLHLAHNAFDAAAGGALADAAAKCARLCEVDLKGNPMGEAAAQTLVTNLKGRPNLDTFGGRLAENLQLQGGGVSAADVVLLAASLGAARETAVTKLDLSSNPLSDSSVGALAHGLSAGPGGGGGLLLLSLNRCGLVELSPFAAGVAASAAGWCSLVSLYLAGNGLGDSACAALAGALAKFSALQVLHLYENHIGDAGAAAFGGAAGGAAALRDVRLYKNAIGDDGLEALAKWVEGAKSLGELYLQENPFSKGSTFKTPPALKAIKAACKSAKVRLNLSTGGVSL